MHSVLFMSYLIAEARFNQFRMYFEDAKRYVSASVVMWS